MAEVFLAKSTGAEGIEKLLVLKRVLPSFARSSKFITMFVDEAKVAMRLNHPNIVQVYAFEQSSGEFLLAMELVDGLDLGRLVAASRRQSVKIPFGLAGYLVMEVAKGLDYAHKRKDSSGVPMEIVHRDVSPQNVLLTYEGVVKVADFGIAKARMVSEETGVIKGKFAYMSPEQARGEKVDNRSDVYSLGVLFAELLMGRAMYPGRQGLDVLEAVRGAQRTLPSEVDPTIPKQLDRIVRRATAADREERYQTARSLAGALAQYLHNEEQVWDAEALEHYIDEVAPREQTSPEGLRRARAFTNGQTVHSRSGTGELRERRLVVVVAGIFREDASRADAHIDAGAEVAKVLADIAYKTDAVLSWPDGPGKGRFRFIVGLGKASVNDPLEAVRIATDTVEALAGLSADLLTPISASLGLSRGTVSTVRDAAGRLLRYSPIGAVIEVAEGLADVGKQGEVLVAGEVYRLLPDRTDRVEQTWAIDIDPSADAAQCGEARRVAGLVCQRSFAAVHAHRHVDDVRTRLLHHVVAQPQAPHRAGSQVLDQHVGFRQQVENQLHALGLLHVDLHAELLRIHRLETRCVVHVVDAVDAGDVERAEAFDADHLGAQVRQQLADIGPGPDLGQLDDAHAGERTTPIARHHAASPPASTSCV